MSEATAAAAAMERWEIDKAVAVDPVDPVDPVGGVASGAGAAAVAAFTTTFIFIPWSQWPTMLQ